MFVPLGFKPHVRVPRMRYPRHIDILAAVVVVLNRRAPGMRVVAQGQGVFECVAGLALLGGVGFPAGALEDDEVEGAEGGEAAADDDAVEFGAGRRVVSLYGDVGGGGTCIVHTNRGKVFPGRWLGSVVLG